MFELGYMANQIASRPDWLAAPNVQDIFAVSNCVSEDFCDYVNFWQHNGFWFFDSPDIVRKTAAENAIDLTDSTLVYYRRYEQQFDGDTKRWERFSADPDVVTNVSVPNERELIGYDVVCYSMQNSPECSPLSCNHDAERLNVNPHCLIDSLDYAIDCLQHGAFDDGEPGPFRIVAVHRVDWSDGG